jgi:hypothetical protein
MTNPVALLRGIRDGEDRYEGLVVWCPGCERPHHSEPNHLVGGLHMLPVKGDGTKRPTWEFNGNLERPTLSPSIMTRYNLGETEVVCHSFLTDGVWNFLDDCTHQYKGQQVPMVPLPDWVVR